MGGGGRREEKGHGSENKPRNFVTRQKQALCPLAVSTLIVCVCIFRKIVAGEPESWRASPRRDLPVSLLPARRRQHRADGTSAEVVGDDGRATDGRTVEREGHPGVSRKVGSQGGETPFLEGRETTQTLTGLWADPVLPTNTFLSRVSILHLTPQGVDGGEIEGRRRKREEPGRHGPTPTPIVTRARQTSFGAICLPR